LSAAAAAVIGAICSLNRRPECVRLSVGGRIPCSSRTGSTNLVYRYRCCAREVSFSVSSTRRLDIWVQGGFRVKQASSKDGVFRSTKASAAAVPSKCCPICHVLHVTNQISRCQLLAWLWCTSALLLRTCLEEIKNLMSIVEVKINLSVFFHI